jgi:hypothetical protein
VQVAALGGKGVGDPASHPAVVTAKGHVGGPRIVLGLQVLQVSEVAQRQERGLQVPVGPLDLALGLGLPGIQTLGAACSC